MPVAEVPRAPAPGLRSSFVQSMLASKRPVRWLWRRRGIDLNARSSLVTLPTHDEHGQPVVLTGWHTPAREGQGHSLVVLIHGWEGSHDSAYLYSMASALHAAGHAVFRLNLRDHGSTHHGLNEAMFHSARLAEVLGAVQTVAARFGEGLPLQVLGFSLGGNFALRVGLHGPARGLKPSLCIGISPALNPGSTLRAIDEGPRLINRYFLDKWHKAMDSKAQAFPQRYNFTAQRQIRQFTEITRAFVADHTDYPGLDDYLAAYTLKPAQLLSSPTPLGILTAADDSVCPAEDFAGLAVAGSVKHYVVSPHGGHCGFIHHWQLQSWAEPLVAQWLLEDASTAH